MTLLDEHSVMWKTAGDVRILMFLGRAFLLQIAHPTIAAGVDEHSTFREDPFGRLHSSFGLVLKAIYAPDGPDVGAEIRASHRGIRGVKPDGTRYQAYEPEAYFWVLATGVDGNRALASWSYGSLSAADRVRMYDETRELGRRMGLRDRDMPATLPEFDDWFDYVCRERLVRAPVMDDFLRLAGSPPAPPGVPGVVWWPFGMAAGRAVTLCSIGTLPAWLRKRLELPWSWRDSIDLELVRQASRNVDLLPSRVRMLPIAQQAYARARAQAFEDTEATASAMAAA